MKIIDNKIGGEIPMGPYDSCRLIHLNLKSFIEEPFTEKAHLNEELLYETAYEAMRLADDLVELEIEAVSRIIDVVKDEDNKLEYELWNKINNTAIQGRRAGLGFTAMGDAIAMLGLKYDSEDGLKMVNQIMKIIFLGELDSEIDMAIERGTFPAYDGYREWHLRENNEAKEGGNDWYEFIRTNFPERANRMSVYGRRNLSFNTVAPTGTVSLMARCSSGIEPIFMPFYQRKRKCMSPGDRVDYTDIKGEKYTLFVVVHPGLMQWASMKYEKTEEELNKEWTIKEWEEAFKKSPYYGSTAPEIDWHQRVKLQGIAQKYITHSISSCLIGDESHLVHTSEGLKYIENLGNHTNGFSPINGKLTTINHEGKCVNIDEFYTNGEKETIKLELKNGTILQGTPNHKLLVLGENYTPKWVELFNIKEGDYIIGRKGLECFGDSQKAISTIMGSSFINNRVGGKSVNIPKRVSKDLARLIGYMISDGFLNANGIGLSQTKNNVINDFMEIIKSEFGLGCKVEKDNRSENLYTVLVNSRVLRDFFAYLGMDKKCLDKDIPKVIYEGAGRRQTAEFIKGLTLDGHVSKDKICIMTSINKRLLLHVQVLLNQFGIESNIIQCNKEQDRLFPSGRYYHTKDAWMIYCTGKNAKLFNQYIGFAEERKVLEFKSKFKAPVNEDPINIPDFGLRNSLKKFKMTFSSSKVNNFIRDFSSDYKNGMSISRDNLLFLSDLGIDIIPEILLDDTYMFVQICKKEYDSVPKETFDLHIKDGHSYLVNGIISHNTVNLSKETTEEEIANIYIESWKEGLKGITIYRDGCREGVLTSISNEKSDNKSESIPSTRAPKRPKELEADYYQVKVKGEQFIVVVGLMDGKPYEVFTFRPTEVMVNFPNHKGKIIKVKKMKYSFESDKLTIPDLKVLTTDIEEKAASLYTSMLLRHGVDIEYIIKTAKKVNDNISSFSSAMCRILSKYITSKDVKGEICPDCGGKLVRDGGCVHCQDCGWSRCS